MGGDYTALCVSHRGARPGGSSRGDHPGGRRQPRCHADIPGSGRRAQKPGLPKLTSGQMLQGVRADEPGASGFRRRRRPRPRHS